MDGVRHPSLQLSAQSLRKDFGRFEKIAEPDVAEKKEFLARTKLLWKNQYLLAKA